MRLAVTAFMAIASIALAASSAAHAQGPGTVSVGFRNNTNTTVIVQGYTIINGIVRRGTPVFVPRDGGTAFETNVPAGLRFYSIHDANQPSSRILLRDHRVLLGVRDSAFGILPSPTMPGQVVLLPASP